MKLFNTIAKVTAAIAAVAGIAFLVYKYMDAIKAWIAKLCPCTEVELEEDFVPEEEITEEPAAEEAAEEVVEEVVAEEPAEEAPDAEEAVAEDAPVADEADFEA